MSAPAIRVVSAGVPGRVRYAVPALERSPVRVVEVERLLREVTGVRDVRASARTATLLLLFDPELPRAPWETVLATLFGSAALPQPEPAGAARVAHPLRARLIALRGERIVRRGREHAPELVDRGLQTPRPRAPSRRTASTGQPAPVAPQPPWYTHAVGDVLGQLESTIEGLASAAAAERLALDGPNAIQPAERRSELQIMLDQLASTPVAMLGASAVASAAMGGIGDAAAILSVLAINASIGYVTESGAERTIAALTRTPQDSIPVLRDGHELPLAVEGVVRGDVIVLQAGVFVAADARVLSAHDLTIDESSLTGESIPVSKHDGALNDVATPLADRKNMVYRGTLVTGGSGTAVVVATGARTELGQIQALAGGIEQRETPMQIQIDRLGRQLAIGAGLACVGMFGVGLLRGMAVLPLVRTAVSLGVAAVPEGLPTVAMTTLALGLSRMRDERVLVRQLSAVETLGSAQIVCLDKTGTLTVNRMTVVAAAANMRLLSANHGHFTSEDKAAVAPTGELEALLQVAVLCNEAQVEQQGALTVLNGSATEGALVQLALDAGVDVAALRARHPVRSVQRRAQTRNYMSTQHDAPDGARLLAVKGRPSEVLALCRFLLHDGERRLLTDADRCQIEVDNERMAGRALRVLGFARLEQSGELDELSGELVWLGLIGMEDPPREGVAEVLARFRQAGLRAVMITGDQSATAQAVGRQIGLGGGQRLEVVDSTRLDTIDPEVLGSLAARADVFSRVSPSHKLQIVRALQKAGYVVAMTGDGVNDGPALKAADIGIAMGAGSTAARELADVVLEDDELRTLVSAIKQGRTIYDDIRKAVHFILSSNFAELAFTFTCVSAGIGEPLTPIQLLWINLFTDIFPELALATQPPESDVLSRPPRDPHRPMFTSGDLRQIGMEGGALTLGALGAFFSTVRVAGPGPRASTVGFTTLMFAQLLNAYSARSEHHSIFERERIPTSRWLPLAVGGTAVVQLLASFVPPLRTLLGIVPMTPVDWGKVMLGSVLPFVFNEGTKLVRKAGGPSALASTLPPPESEPCLQTT